jgi:ribosomal protein S27AE
MGYNDGLWKAACGSCGTGVYWRLQPSVNAPKKWTCGKCGSTNVLKRPPEWPDVPIALYIGHDKQHQVKVYPLLPDDPDVDWARPYCTRSFIAQISGRLGGCTYTTSIRAWMMGQPVFRDHCHDVPLDWDDEHACHLMAGFSIGTPTCLLWEELGRLCQTDAEKRFLRWYLELVKDRQFPMLIPQARIGIAERRRPDFVAFVPLHYWSYKRYAIQLDGAHTCEQARADHLRDAEIAVHGYNVRSVGGAFRDAQALVEQIDHDMESAKADPWSVALQVAVARTDPAEQ